MKLGVVLHCGTACLGVVLCVAAAGCGGTLEPSVVQLDFGTVTKGTPASRSLLVTECDQWLLGVDFPEGPVRIGALAESPLVGRNEFTATFLSNRSGAFDGTIRTQCQVGRDVFISWSAIVVEPQLDIQDSVIDFGVVWIDETRIRHVRLRNLSSGMTLVRAFSQLDREFKVQTPEISIPAGAEEVLEVVFDPVNLGLAGAEVVTEWCESCRKSVSFVAEAAGSPLAVSDPSIDFGSIESGQRYTADLVLQNVSAELVEILSVAPTQECSSQVDVSVVNGTLVPAETSVVGVGFVADGAPPQMPCALEVVYRFRGESFNVRVPVVASLGSA